MVMLLGFLTVTPSQAGRLNVIELFTSQACSSCPPADRLLGDLIEQHDGLIALEYHVDYWDKLVHGGSNWQDPYSSADYSNRQRQYSRIGLRGNPGVYTPQAVVNGTHSMVGSSRRNILKALTRANDPTLDVAVTHDGDQLQVTVNGYVLMDSQVVLVHFLKKTNTRVTGGENNGVDITNHHVVTDVRLLGELNKNKLSGEAGVGTQKGQFSVAYAGGEQRGCAVLVQPHALGPILGAASCP